LNIINGIRSYILENDLKITILDNKINIVNYIDIGHFDSNKIVVKTNNRDIIIKGNDLVVSKLMSSEILITGEFNIIEFR
jgi:sporulation protein YqfC